VPSTNSKPLGPDACGSDPAAPCCYYHLKIRALNGDRLDAEQAGELRALMSVGPTQTRLEFIG
jgi:hypothetical protein